MKISSSICFVLLVWLSHAQDTLITQLKPKHTFLIEQQNIPRLIQSSGYKSLQEDFYFQSLCSRFTYHFSLVDFRGLKKTFATHLYTGLSYRSGKMYYSDYSGSSYGTHAYSTIEGGFNITRFIVGSSFVLGIGKKRLLKLATGFDAAIRLTTQSDLYLHNYVTLKERYITPPSYTYNYRFTILSSEVAKIDDITHYFKAVCFAFHGDIGTRFNLSKKLCLFLGIKGYIESRELNTVNNVSDFNRSVNYLGSIYIGTGF